jgi:hypothetical protein
MVMSSEEEVQMEFVVEASETARPDEAVGVTAKAVADHGRSVGAENVIV